MNQWEFCEIYWKISSWTPYSPTIMEYDPENLAIKHEFKLVQTDYSDWVLNETFLTKMTEEFLHHKEEELKEIIQRDKELFKAIQSDTFHETNLYIVHAAREEIAKLGLAGWELVTVTRDNPGIDEYLAKPMPNLTLRYYLKRQITT